MAAYGYSYVTEKGFSAFARDLEDGAWKDVSIKKYDVEDRVPEALLLEAPRPVVWKLRARWAIAALDVALGIASEDELAALDVAWDSGQRALNLFLGAAAEDEDRAHREAAGRLRARLLKGAGVEQTRLSYDDEVDFGRDQIRATASGPLAEDVKTVGCGPHLKRIAKATEALAKGRGRQPGQKATGSRSKRVRDALVACSAAFNAIHDEIEWLTEHTPQGKQRDLLVALHAPFLALLERNPPIAAKAAPADGKSAEPAPAPPAAPPPAEAPAPVAEKKPA